MIHFCDYPPNLDLKALTQALWQQKIPHRVRLSTTVANIQQPQEIWLLEADQASQAKAICEQIEPADLTLLWYSFAPRFL